MMETRSTQPDLPADRTHTLPPGSLAHTRDLPTPPLSAWPSVPGYEVLGELGRGGMGVVYQAKHLRLGRVVALKMILIGAHASAEQRQRFVAEAQAVARLQHPNIVQVFEIAEAAPAPYFSLEFVPGGTLAQRAGGTPQPPHRAAQLVETLARAMDYAHGQGVVHRDLKPGNILLTAEGAPKITDFGLAKLSDAAGPTRTGAIVGTPAYMAPEQAEGRAVGPLTDLHALGALLYELLTGRPPFQADSLPGLLAQIMLVEPLPPRQLVPSLPRDLEIICLKCLEKVPQQRYASAGALADDLRRFQADESIAARPPTVAQRWHRFARRHRALVWATTLVGCTLTLGLLGTSVGLWRAWAAEGQLRTNVTQLLAARQQLHRDLLDSHLTTAKLACQRGDWQAALQADEAALLLDPPDVLGLRLHRVLVRTMLNDRAGAERELHALAQEPDLGPHEGLLHLLRGDLSLSRWHDRAAALADLHRALELGLSPADTAYVRGLLAERTIDAELHFRTALALDPFHVRAHQMLLIDLVMLGRATDARQQAHLTLQLFPDDPNPRVVLALFAVIAGDPATAQRELDQVLPRFDTGTATAIRRGFELAQLAARPEADFAGWAGVWLKTRAATQLTALLAEGRGLPALQLTGGNFVNLPAAANGLGVFLDPIVRAWRGQEPSVAELAHMEEALVGHPLGDLALMLATFKLNRASLELNRPGGRDWPAIYALLFRSATLFQQAAESPCLIASHPRAARGHALQAQVLCARAVQLGPPDPRWHATALANVRWFLGQPDLTPAEAQFVAGLALELGEPSLARAVTQAGLERQPRAVDLWQVLLRVDQAIGAHQRTRTTAQRLLQLAPNHPAAQQVLAEP
jgi:tetratricopeptide (TPR) repeat protein